MMALSQRFPPPRHISFALLTRRTILGSTALVGLMLVIATEFRSMATGLPHRLTILWFGVSLIIGSAMIGAILSILARGTEGKA